ncbi:MAG: FAD-dependent oxidoreductase [Pyrinomonadaceae bacterium]
MKQLDPGYKKAVVIGGGMSGLLAARILSDFYEQVIILERDNLSDSGENRHGVPQGWHAHGLLASGSQVLEELFPGLVRDLTDGGAITADVVKDGRWFFEGDCLLRVPSGTTGILLSRPFLESAIRRRVRDRDRVRILDNSSVRDLAINKDRVEGVVTDTGTLPADLVVDASGRGSKALRWLQSSGFTSPPEEKVEVQLTYTTRYFRRRETGGVLFTSVAPSNGITRSGVILAQEGDRWVVTLTGRFGDKPPEDIAGFLRFSKSLAAPYIYDMIRNAMPIGDALTMRFPTSVRRQYERLSRVPKGFLVFGDAICSFNPVYGQGMSVAALQALVLREQLSKGEGELAGAFYKAAAKVNDTPWNIAVGSDLKMPNVKGKRTIAGRLMSSYVSRLQKLAHRDAEASLAFMRVAQLLDGPSALLQPKLAWRVLTGRSRRRPDAAKLPEKAELAARRAVTSRSQKHLDSEARG